MGYRCYNYPTMKDDRGKYIWTFLRLGMSWIFLWAFIDKVFGLGFATSPDKAWIMGASPTFGYLTFGTHGALSSFFQHLAGNAVVDWLFMMGLLGVGLGLLLGIGIRISGYSGALLLSFIWLSRFPPEQNPFMDEHIIYIIILLGLPVVNSGRWFPLGTWWSHTPLVQRYPFLQ